MRVAFGTDESTPVTEELKDELARLGHEVLVVADPMRWAQAGRAVGEAVAGGRADVGVVCCFTGTGVAMAANKVAGATGGVVCRCRDGARSPNMERRQRAGTEPPAYNGRTRP